MQNFKMDHNKSMDCHKSQYCDPKGQVKTKQNPKLQRSTKTLQTYLKIPSNGSTSGSQASNCLLNVEAAIEQTKTAFIDSRRPCVTRLMFVIVVSKTGVICMGQNKMIKFGQI